MTAPRRPSAPTTARARARAAVLAELMATARAHAARDGAAALSLRAVARDLGMTSSAVYRYVASRDELLTLLVLDSYRSVAQVMESTDRAAAAAGADAAGRWLAVSRSFRTWAIANLHEYALLYGSPVPGYHAPAETIPVAIRIWRVVLGIVDSAIASGALRPPERPFDVDGLIAPEVVAVAGGAPAPPFADSPVRTLALFSSLIGTVTADVFGHFQGFSPRPDRVFDLVIATAAAGVGLELPVGQDA